MRSSFLYSSKEIKVNSKDLIPQAFYLDTLFFVIIFCELDRRRFNLRYTVLILYDYVKINNNDYDKISKRNILKYKST